MSLLDDLREAGRALDLQYQPTSNEIQGVVAALVHYAEHGQEFLTAAEHGAEDLDKLLAPAPPEPAPAADVAEPAPGGAPAAATSDSELEAQIADLEAQLAARRATAQQTVVEHQTGPGPVEPAAPVPVAPASDVTESTQTQPHGLGRIFGGHS